MIYFIQAIRLKHIKIGYTSLGDISKRLKALVCASPDELMLLGVIPGEEANRNLEKYLHKRFKHLKIHHEWFYSKNNKLENNELINFIENLFKEEYIDEKLKIVIPQA